MYARQVGWGKQILQAVSTRAHHEDWGLYHARRMARMCIMCALTESDLWMYANGNLAVSLRLPHDRVGWDHASVGLFQQQVPWWGTAAELMDAETSCRRFMGAAQAKGVDDDFQLPLRLAIQRVQVSFDPNGWNYEANRARAGLFVANHWDFRKRAVK